MKTTLGGDMKRKTFFRSVSVLCLLLVLSAASLAQGKKIKEGAEQAKKAAVVLEEIMETPDKSIPRDLLAKAECVAVFPQVIKGGFIVGARGGRGVASCRAARGWSPPAYFNLGGGSVGLQIGAQATDFVLLFMNKQGLNSLLSSKLTLGGDASVAAGPVGRQAGADTDVVMKAQILSYSRSRGVFGGLELKGVVIHQDKDLMNNVYGDGITAKDVLQGDKVKAPTGVLTFPETLARYSTRKAK
jgi:lipid-binding SYLF domain-containing protein